MEEEKETYKLLSSKAILGPLAEDIRTMKLMSTPDGLARNELLANAIDMAWVWAGSNKSRLCDVWDNYYFQRYNLISRNCFSCWKVVCRINSIKDLLKIRELQVNLNENDSAKYVGKCGVENRREFSYLGRYVAIWYCPLSKDNTLFEAKEIAKKIESMLKDINPSLEVSLERGCPHMERAAGPSDKWTYPAEAHIFEDKLDDLFCIAPKEDNQTIEMKNLIIKSWIDHAFFSGDPDVADLVANFPFDFGIVVPVNYYKNTPKILSNIVRRGKLDGSSIDRSSKTTSGESAIHLV